ncbi:MAG: flagellar biosynthetic protein FliR [Moraxellaceae bacterium]|nr:flagellar biosynthetic protein FliR [Moraxellaceae bacterium]MDZ4385695.1 flagellar biosynthetic protein FliR [Moraxellaceae bacterium]
MSLFLLSVLLVSVRLLPILVVAPITAFARAPMMIRMVLTLALALVLTSALPVNSALNIGFAVIAGELLLGAVMAFGFHAAYAGLDMAGKLIDTQMGLNASGVFDPSTNNITSIVAELMTLTFMLLFFILDVHHDLLRVFAALLVVVPPGSVSGTVLSTELAQVMMQQFLLAFMMLVPVILGLWLVDAAFAFLARSMPQANIYFLALPVKLGIGVFLLVLTLPLVVQRIPLLFEAALRAPVKVLGAP